MSRDHYMNEYLFGLFSFIGMVATFTCIVLGLFKAMNWWLNKREASR